MKKELKYAIVFIIVVLALSWSFTLFAFSTPERSKLFVLVMFIPALVGITINFLRYKSAKMVFKPITAPVKLKSILFAIGYPVLFLVIIGVIVLFTKMGTLSMSKLSNLAQFPTLEMIIIGPLLLFGEEYGWRGLLLKEVAEARGKITGAIVVGMVWALWHAPILYGLALQSNAQNPFTLTLIQMGAVFTFSMPFAYCYFLTSNILAPMLLHFVWNFYNPILLGSLYRHQFGVIEGELMIINGEGLTGFILGLILMIWFIRKPLFSAGKMVLIK